MQRGRRWCRPGQRPQALQPGPTARPGMRVHLGPDGPGDGDQDGPARGRAFLSFDDASSDVSVYARRPWGWPGRQPRRMQETSRTGASAACRMPGNGSDGRRRSSIRPRILASASPGPTCRGGRASGIVDGRRTLPGAHGRARGRNRAIATLRARRGVNLSAGPGTGTVVETLEALAPRGAQALPVAALPLRIANTACSPPRQRRMGAGPAGNESGLMDPSWGRQRRSPIGGAQKKSCCY